MSSRKITVAGLFSGCGGLDFGFMKAGYDITWSNEINSDAAISYERLIGHKPVVDDIWNVIEQVPNVDVIIGGPPCQSFSLAGKRIEDDPRGKLVLAYYQVVKKIMPKLFVMENVSGLISSKIDGVRMPDYLKKKFEDLGYKVVVKKIIATDFFVPQKRNRVFLIGHKCNEFDVEILKMKDFSHTAKLENMNKVVSVSH